MKIGLIGYGAMGREVERVAVLRGHEVVVRVDADNRQDLDLLRGCDVAVEFTTPATAAANVMYCLKSGIPIICGTTGWDSELEVAKEYCREVGGTLFHSSNFSIGVNIFFRLNEWLARVMNEFSEYNVSLREVHHIRKVDSPSGTARILANQIVKISDSKERWVNLLSSEKSDLSVVSIREGDVAGVHTVTYTSDADVIEIQHVAKNRSGFALGAVLAAEYALTHKGMLTMEEMLGSQ